MIAKVADAMAGANRDHTKALIGLVFVAVALVGLGTGVLIGWAGRGSPQQDPSAEPATIASPSPSSTSPTARPTVRASSDVEPGRHWDIGYFLGARQKQDGLHVVFDRGTLLRGRAAKEHAREHDLQGPLRDGELLININPRTRDMVLAPDVRVLGRTRLAGTAALEQVSLARLLESVGAGGDPIPLTLRYDDLGYVIEVREKNLP